MNCKANELGTSPEGCKVIAATDAAGPQVIAYTPDHKIHLLSQPLADHAAAVVLGKQVVAEGTGVYTEWTDLHADPMAALWSAMMRG